MEDIQARYHRQCLFSAYDLSLIPIDEDQSIGRWRVWGVESESTTPVSAQVSISAQQEERSLIEKKKKG
jgi:hypothetical protein